MREKRAYIEYREKFSSFILFMPFFLLLTLNNVPEREKAFLVSCGVAAGL